MPSRPPLVISAALVLILAGCSDREIRSYRIQKEAAPAAAAGATSPRTEKPPIRWEKPEAWQEQPGNSMRVGSFSVPGTHDHPVDMAVTTFPGDVGGDLANVNRWRGQIELPPLSEAELGAIVSVLDLPAGRFQLVDLISATELLSEHHKARILGAWLKQPDRTWFFKMVGDSDGVGDQRETFLAFLRTIAFASPAAPPVAADTNRLPAEAVPATSAPPPSTTVGLTWTAPSDWTAKPLGQMRKGSYTLRSDDGTEADLSITSLSAATNPLLANINRWRRQIGLDPLTEADLPAQTTTVNHDGLIFTVVDYAGGGSRVLGAILYLGDEAWFFKLSGPDASVAPQKPAFLEFLRTVKNP